MFTHLRRFLCSLIATAVMLGAVVLVPPELALAAGLNYTADTTIALTSPAINLVIKQGSAATSVTVNAGNLQASLPVSTTFTITSASRGLSVSTGSPQTINVTVTCSASGVATAAVTTSSGTPDTITFSPQAVQCGSSGGGNSGGGGGSGSVPSPAPNPAPSPAPPPANNPPSVQPPIVQPPPLYPIGTLVQEGSTIYLIAEPHTAVGFTNWKAFVGLGYQYRYVIFDNLPGYSIPTDYFLSSPTQAHPWSAWVRSGGTVYYVSPQGLIGVPSYAIFQSNGGQDKFILPANKADLQILKANSHLPLLESNDSRVLR